MTVKTVSFHRTPEFMSVDQSRGNNNSNLGSVKRIVKDNFPVRRRFQTETGIRLAFHTRVKKAQFWAIKLC